MAVLRGDGLLVVYFLTQNHFINWPQIEFPVNFRAIHIPHAQYIDLLDDTVV